jgi:hypothetical protein
MRSLNSIVFRGRGDRQPAQHDARVYSHPNANAKSRLAETPHISRHPVISILRRIDELNHREEAGRGVKQPDQTLAELEACLAEIQRSTG